MSAKPVTPKNSAPLAGYRVLELGSTVAGPFCGRLFVDFGAEGHGVETLIGLDDYYEIERTTVEKDYARKHKKK